MNIQKWSPWNWFNHEDDGKPVAVKEQVVSPLQRLQDDFEQFFSNFSSQFGFPESKGGILKPQLDIRESEHQYVITVEVPGVDPKDMDIRVEDNVLTVRGEKKREHEEKSDNVHRVERSYGSFQRVLSLPENADLSKISAKFEKGILNITVDKHLDTSMSKGRRIDIE